MAIVEETDTNTTVTPKPKAVEEASKYSKRELITAAKTFFSVKPEIMAGALYGLTEDITVAAAQARLDAFRKKGVE